MSARRLAKEFKEVDTLLGNRVWEDPDLGPFTWHLVLDPSHEMEHKVGPYENVFHGVQIHSVITFPKDYPFKPFRMELDQGWVKAAVESKPTAIVEVRHQNQISALQDDERSQRQALMYFEHSELPFPILLSEQEVGARERLARDEELARSAMPSGCVQGGRGHLGIIVKTMTGKILQIDAALDDTIETIKSRIEHKDGGPFSFARLVHAGKQLQDGRTLGDYGILLGSTIHALPFFNGCNCRYLLTPDTPDWSPALTVVKEIVNRTNALFDSAYEIDNSNCGCEKRRLQYDAFGKRPFDDVHWLLRCTSPSVNVVWSPDNDRYWPMRFRKNIRYLTKISLKGKQVSGSDRIPVDVVSVMGSYL